MYIISLIDPKKHRKYLIHSGIHGIDSRYIIMDNDVPVFVVNLDVMYFITEEEYRDIQLNKII